MSQNNGILEQLQNQPPALKTTVQIKGVISLSDEDSERLDVTNKALSQTLMELSLLSNNTDMPAKERATRLLALREPVTTSTDALVIIATHAADDVTRAVFDAEAQGVLTEVKKFNKRLAGVFSEFASFDEAQQIENSLKYSQEASNSVLTVLEKVMELLAVPDRATVAAIDEACDLLAKTVAAVQSEFVEGKTQEQITKSFVGDTQRVKALVDASQALVTYVATCLRAFTNRLPVITSPEAKTELEQGMQKLQENVPKLLNIAQGSVPDSGEASKIVEFLQRAKVCVRQAPGFSARVLAEFVDGSALGIASSNLATAVEHGSTAEIGENARKYALAVSSIVAQCRAIGVDSMECDLAQAALADVIRLAKIATASGDPEDIKKFKAALDYLTSMVQNLPKKFSRQLYGESSTAFIAAREMSRGSLVEFVNSMKKK